MATKPPIPAAAPVAKPQPAPPTKTLKFRAPDSSDWQDLRPSIPEEATVLEKKEQEDKAARAKDALKAVLLSSLQMQHVVVLAGSGTSLGDPVNGPSMWDLWDHCVNEKPGGGEGAERVMQEQAKNVISKIGYDPKDTNIESLLSRCEAYLQINQDETVLKFLTASKMKILTMCRTFLGANADSQLQAHRTFLHRLSRRRARDSRVKVFTTNYDLCYETAASRQGLIAINGFSFGQPREYDPRFFGYDIVRRSTTGDDSSFVEGIFSLYKLHGSVNWERTVDGGVRETPEPSADAACIIYPAKGKYQQSYLQPHLELMSQYLAALREPNTCLIVIGFGFNDDHLSEPILSAIQNNPHLRVIVVNKAAEKVAAEKPAEQKNRFWKNLLRRSLEGADIWVVNSDFQDFASLIPDLKSLTPAQRLAQDIKKIAEPK